MNPFTYSPLPADDDVHLSPHLRVPVWAKRAWESVSLYLVCVAITICAALFAILFVKPHWNALGLPSFYHYGKNKEQAAILLSLVGIALFSLIARRRIPGVYPLAAIAAALIGFSLYFRDFSGLQTLLKTLIGVGIYFVWYERYRHERTPAVSVAAYRWPIAVVLVLIATAYFFITSCNPLGLIDLHHQGEVVASALDINHGGIPYRTFFIPHGMSDTGLTALFMRLTGGWGTGVLVLANATTNVIGFLSLYLICLLFLRDPLHAFVVAFFIAAVTTVFFLFLSFALFTVIAFVILTRTIHPFALLVSGVLIALGHLWRVEVGVYSLMTVIAYLLVDCYYTNGYARDGRWQHLLDGKKASLSALRIACLFAGVGLGLYGFYLLAGFPTVEWFRTTLVDLPRYHRDSTGTPLPLPWGSPRFLQGGGIAALVTLPFCSLLLFSLLAYILVKVRERRFPTAEPYDRAYLLFFLYGLVNYKTVLDRPDLGHIIAGTMIFMVLLLMDLISHPLARFRHTPRIPYTLAVCSFGLLCVSVGVYGFSLRTPVPVTTQQFDTLRACLQPVHTPEEALAVTTQSTDVILKGVHEVRGLLDEHGVGRRELLIHHSAAFVYPLLGQELPTKYYQMGWAATPDMERELIGEIRSHSVRAYLHMNGIGGSLKEYDIGDEYRMPLVHEYLEGQKKQGKSYKTALGDLVILDEPDARANEDTH